MPTRVRKSQTNKRLTVERIHHAKSYGLDVDRTVCVGCELCSLICPREAITIKKTPQKLSGKTQRAQIDIDEAKCHYCGICAAICPFGAVTINVDGKTIASVVEKESFPQLIREIRVDTSKCPTDCSDCQEHCPLDLITVTSNPETSRVAINIDQERCPCCRICEIRCPEGAIQVRKIFTGTLRIHTDQCPPNCHDCLDVCPVTDALYISEKDKKVHGNDMFCVYCGSCKIVCPVDTALELTRSAIRHTPVRSGAWNRSLEKLTSTAEMTKELRGKGRKRTMEAVEKRLIPRKKKND